MSVIVVDEKQTAVTTARADNARAGLTRSDALRPYSQNTTILFQWRAIINSPNTPSWRTS